MAGIGELSVSVTARTEKAMKNVRNFRKSINRLPSVIGRAATSMTGMATAAASLVGVGAIGQEIQKSFASIDDLAKTSDRLGIATEKLSALRFAAEESGVAAKTTDMALQRMVRRVAEAAQGTGEAVKALQELGLSAQQLAQLSPDQQFAKIADAMKGVTNQSDRVRLAMKLFDSEGVSLVNTLRLGSEGLAQYEKEAAKLGITVSRFDASQIEKANDAFGRIGKVVEGLANRIAIGLAPVVEGVANTISEWGSNSQVSTDQITDGMKQVGKATGFVLNGIEFWLRAFKQVRAYISEFFAWMASKMLSMSQRLAELLNKLPGVDTSVSEFTVAFADEMEGAAKEARRKADEAWSKPWPSQSVDKFFADMDKKIKKSRKEMERAATTPGGGITLDATRVGGLVAKSANWLSKTLGETGTQLSKVMSKSASSANRQAPGILNARTAEGYAQLRANLGRDDTQKKMLEEQKKETGATQQLVTAFDNLARQIPIPKILSFGES
jgi:hypothetical protein